MHTEPRPEDLPDRDDTFEEEEFGDTELDRDDTHGLAAEAAEAAEQD